MNRLIIYVFVIVSHMMGYAQLNENILSKNFDMIKSIDFRLVSEEDYDNLDIEYKSDYYYEPKNESPMTFLGYPVSVASFYLTNDQKVKSFGMKILADNATLFYQKVKEKYGSFSVSSPSDYFFEKHGIFLPKEYSEEAENMIKNLPIPTVEEYKDTRTISWYLKIERNTGKDNATLKIYNHPVKGLNFESPNRELRIVFSLDDLED